MEMPVLTAIPTLTTSHGASGPITRRRFATIAGSALTSLALGGACSATAREGADGRITARPHADVKTTAERERRLGLEPGRDGILRLPPNTGSDPLPLFVLLHGAGGGAEGILRRLGSASDAAGIVVFAPDSRGATWDAIRDWYGPDVRYLNRALARVFETVNVDASRIAIGGFSDGATYAISLGLINGDLFSKVVAWSPGFVARGSTNGRPRFFISHGTSDRILPIDQCSRKIVPALGRHGCQVTFREFDGGHTVPADIASAAMEWLAEPSKH
jgi:phospholipase/carboxylesterase